MGYEASSASSRTGLWLEMTCIWHRKAEGSVSPLEEDGLNHEVVPVVGTMLQLIYHHSATFTFVFRYVSSNPVNAVHPTPLGIQLG